MVRATGRRTSRLCRDGCRDGATAAQFWSLSDKIIVSSHPPILLVAKSGAHPFYGFDRRNKRRVFAALHVPPLAVRPRAGVVIFRTLGTLSLESISAFPAEALAGSNPIRSRTHGSSEPNWGRFLGTVLLVALS